FELVRANDTGTERVNTRPNGKLNSGLEAWSGCRGSSQIFAAVAGAAASRAGPDATRASALSELSR
ncbi:hypothetical protein, partial [Serratia marcescens]|uniref:hypothetical protein n=1 Tax=Serratia marcescens TaxID=615 RepID=UPI001C2D36AB